MASYIEEIAHTPAIWQPMQTMNAVAESIYLSIVNATCGDIARGHITKHLVGYMPFVGKDYKSVTRILVTASSL